MCFLEFKFDKKNFISIVFNFAFNFDPKSHSFYGDNFSFQKDNKLLTAKRNDLETNSSFHVEKQQIIEFW